MKTIVSLALAGSLLTTTAALDASHKEPPGQRETNWGERTSSSIQGGFDQGTHASDPAGDGTGKGSSDQPRDGLANAGGEKGDLSNTMNELGL